MRERAWQIRLSRLCHKLVVCFSVALCLPGLSANLDEVTFRHASIREGLSQSSGLCFLQDDAGFIWIGTYDGLNRYDGRHFRVFSHDAEDPTSLSDNGINCLAKDSSGNLWIGTNYGLNRYELKTGIFYPYYHDPSDPTSLNHDQILTLLARQDGKLLVGTEVGLMELDPQTGQFREISYQTSAETKASFLTFSLLQTKDNTIWIGSWGRGLNRYNPRTQQAEPVLDAAGKQAFGYKITAMCEDRHGDLWVGTLDNGLSRFDPKTGRAIYYQMDPQDPNSIGSNQIRAVIEDQGGSIWVATYGKGLNRYDPLRGGFEQFRHDPKRPSSLAHDQVMSLMVDRSGNLWVGTFLGGVDLFEKRKVKFNPVDLTSVGESQIWSICEDQNQTLWLGGEKGLYQQDARGLRLADNQPGTPLSGGRVLSVEQGREGRIWIGHSRGLSLYDGKEGQFQHFLPEPNNPESLSDNHVTNVLEDGKGYLWASTNQGLNRLDPSHQKFVQFQHDPADENSLGNSMPRDLLEDRRGLIWVGTEGAGLSCYEGGARFKTYRHQLDQANSLSSNNVMALLEDRRDQDILWVGTAGGLNRFSKQTGAARIWRTHQGLPNDFIYALGQDMAGLLWMSTNRGLAVFDPSTDRFRSFDVRDGLPSNEFNVLSFAQGADGRMYFGSLEGLVSFLPRDFSANTKPVALFLTDFLVANKPMRTNLQDPSSPLLATISHTEKLTLDHRHQMVGFDFSALEFNAPWHCRYAYFLEGFDRDWVHTEAENTRATYTNLPPGDYTFRVKASNADGLWNKDDLELKVAVLSPTWLRPGAKLGYIGVTVSLVGWFFLMMRSRLRRQRKIADQERLLKEQAQLIAENERASAARLERLVKERTKALITQEKMATLGTLSSGVAHEINNPNNFVQGGVQSMTSTLEEFDHFLQSTGLGDRSSKNGRFLRGLLEDLSEQRSLIEKGSKRIQRVASHMEHFAHKGEGYFRTNILEGVESTITLVRSQFPEVDFQIRGEEELFCHVRIGELNQVFLNIVLNGCEAIMRRRDIDALAPARIEILALRFEELAVLKFIDTGDGFTMDHAERLFEAFYTTKKTNEAAGLGLFSAWRVVNEHQGTLEAHSQPGQGSTFTVKLPLFTEKPSG